MEKHQKQARFNPPRQSRAPIVTLAGPAIEVLPRPQPDMDYIAARAAMLSAGPVIDIAAQDAFQHLLAQHQKNPTAPMPSVQVCDLCHGIVPPPRGRGCQVCKDWHLKQTEEKP